MLTYQQEHPSQVLQPQVEQEQSPFILTVGYFGFVCLNLSYLDILSSILIATQKEIKTQTKVGGLLIPNRDKGTWNGTIHVLHTIAADK